VLACWLANIFEVVTAWWTSTSNEGREKYEKKKFSHNSLFYANNAC
jgi:hypothetical protein